MTSTMLLAGLARVRTMWWQLVWACIWLCSASCVVHVALSRLTHYSERPMRSKSVFFNQSREHSPSATLNFPTTDIFPGSIFPSNVANGSGEGALKYKREPVFLTLNWLHSGRLGNHMFMYASLMGLARTTRREPFISPGFSLDLAFKLQHLAEVPDTEKWASLSQSGYATFDNGLVKKLLSEKFHHINTTISGYFQSWKYFKDIAPEIRTEFTFRDSVLQRRDRILNTVLGTRRPADVLLVGVHVRRSDLTLSRNVALGYTTPKPSYFFKAFDWMRKKVNSHKVVFLVVSDDMVWCERHLTGSDVILAPPASQLVHLSLLASCNHVVISTGTFGWWGAWLAGGDVVYYKNVPANGSYLSAGFSRGDYFPESWVGLGD